MKPESFDAWLASVPEEINLQTLLQNIPYPDD